MCLVLTPEVIKLSNPRLEEYNNGAVCGRLAACSVPKRICELVVSGHKWPLLQVFLVSKSSISKPLDS